MLRDAARAAPDVTYIAADDGSLTFSEMDALSESLAASLLEIGLKPGDRAIFQLGTVKEIVVALFGCFKASVVPVCTLPQYREIEIGQLTELSGAKAYFVQGDFSPAFDLAAFARRMMAEHRSLDDADRRARAARRRRRIRTRRIGEPAMRPTTRAPAHARGRSVARRCRVVPIVRRLDRRAQDHSAHARANISGPPSRGTRATASAATMSSLWALPLIHNAGMLVMLVPSLISRRKLVIQSRFELDAFLRAIAKTSRHLYGQHRSDRASHRRMSEYRGLRSELVAAHVHHRARGSRRAEDRRRKPPHLRHHRGHADDHASGRCGRGALRDARLADRHWRRRLRAQDRKRGTGRSRRNRRALLSRARIRCAAISMRRR